MDLWLFKEIVTIIANSVNFPKRVRHEGPAAAQIVKVNQVLTVTNAIALQLPGTRVGVVIACSLMNHENKNDIT